MKKLLLLLVLLGGINYAFSQSNDIIVLQSGDTIPCKIRQFSDDKIKFSYTKDGERKNCVILYDQVSFYKKKYYYSDGDNLRVRQVSPADLYDKFSFAFDFGVAKGIGKIDSRLNSRTRGHLANLQKHLLLHSEVYWYLSKSVGLGFNYDRTIASNQERLFFYSLGVSLNVKTEDKISFFGPSLCLRRYVGGKSTMLVGKFSLGMLSFDRTNNYDGLAHAATYEGNTFGVRGSFGVEQKISKYIGIGAEVNILSAKLSQLSGAYSHNKEDFSLDDKEAIRLTRIGACAGIRIYL